MCTRSAATRVSLLSIFNIQSVSMKVYACEYCIYIYYLITILVLQLSMFEFLQELEPGALVLLRNSARDGRKGDKLAQRWLGPYRIEEHIGKGVYRLVNPATGRILKKAFNACMYVCTHVAH